MQIKKIFLEKRQGAFIRAVMFIRIYMLIDKNCWGRGGGGGGGGGLVPISISTCTGQGGGVLVPISISTCTGGKDVKIYSANQWTRINSYRGFINIFGTGGSRQSRQRISNVLPYNSLLLCSHSPNDVPPIQLLYKFPLYGQGTRPE